jgi:hypothetical protein
MYKKRVFLVLLWLSVDHGIPPLGYGMVVEANVAAVMIVPGFHQIPYGRSAGAVFAKVVSHLRLMETQGT